MNEQIIRIVDKSMDGVVNHMKNVKQLVNLYKQSDFLEFQDSFKRMLFGLIKLDYENPQVKNGLEFLGKFLSYLASHDQPEEQEAEDSSASEQPMRHPFLKNVCNEVIKYHTHPSSECRYNTCSFLSAVLQNMGHNVVMDEDISGRIMSAMLENVQDHKPEIRMQSLWALARLQDPIDKQCPAIAAFMNCLRDSKAKIRKEAVKKIAPNKISNSKLQERLRDKDAGVRVAAFNHVADIGIKRFKIIERQRILRNGFGEENAHVKKVFLEYLLPKWLTTMNGSYLDLLQAIRLDADEHDLERSEKLCSKIMDQFFKTETIDALIKALPLDENNIIPEDLVKTELVQYWNIIVKYLRQSDDLDEHLEKVIPSLTIFCVYIDTIITTKYTRAVEEWQKLDQQYLLYQLFNMAEDYDLSDEMGRKSLNTLILKVLKNYRFQPRLLIKLIEIARKMATNADTFADEICNIILDIWQPITEHVISQPAANVPDGARKFEINKNKVQLIDWKMQLEEAIKKQNFILASELKEKISNLKIEMDEAAVPAPLPLSQVVQTKTPTDDPEKLCWCLDMLAALLGYGGIDNMTQFLINCREEIVLSTITKENVEISNRSFKCFMLYAIYDQPFAREHIKVICAPIARYSVECSKTILLDSIKVLSDLIRIYGTNLFINETESTDSTVRTKRLYQMNDDFEEDKDKTCLTIDEVIEAFLDMLDDQDEDIINTAALSLGKLICNGFPVTTTIITKLILKYFDPGSQNKLQQYLGMIISFYCQRVQESRNIISKAIIPILTNVAEAPRDDTIADVDIDNIIKFLVTMTDAVNKDESSHVHVSIAKIVIDELALRPTEMVSGYLSKVLIQLRVPAEPAAQVQEMIRTSETILDKQEVITKMVANNMRKFIAKLRGQPMDATENSINSTKNTTNTTNTNAAARRLSTLTEENDEVFAETEPQQQKPAGPNGLKRPSENPADDVPNKQSSKTNANSNNRPIRSIKPNGRYKDVINLSPRSKNDKTEVSVILSSSVSSESERSPNNNKQTRSSTRLESVLSSKRLRNNAQKSVVTKENPNKVDGVIVIQSSSSERSPKRVKKRRNGNLVGSDSASSDGKQSPKRISLRKSGVDVNKNVNKRTLSRSPSQSVSPNPKHFKGIRHKTPQRVSVRQLRNISPENSTSAKDSQSSQDSPVVRIKKIVKTKLKSTDERNSLRRIQTNSSTDSSSSPNTRSTSTSSPLRSMRSKPLADSDHTRKIKTAAYVKVTPLKDMNRTQLNMARTSPRNLRRSPVKVVTKKAAKENNAHLHSRVEALRGDRAQTRSSTSEETLSDRSLSEPINATRSKVNSNVFSSPDRKGRSASTRKRNQQSSPFRRSKREVKKPRLADFV